MNNPAQTVIDRLGGFSVVREICNVAESTVHRWTYEKERGGTGGTIPYKHIPKLLKYAQTNRIKLSAADLLPRSDA